MDDARWMNLLSRLARSAFRSKFHLSAADRQYIESKGMGVVASHARDFVVKRLAPAHPVNDGRQTPWKGHPVFVAQHATGTCCRGCLRKWHGIADGTPLTEAQVDMIVDVLVRWMAEERGKAGREQSG